MQENNDLLQSSMHSIARLNATQNRQLARERERERERCTNQNSKETLFFAYHILCQRRP